MAYEFDQFTRDCRQTLMGGQTPAELEQVRQLLTKLLGNQAFVEKTCGAKAEGGLHRIYVDPELGFEVLAHINEKARTSPPHDHGESWAIYGQAIGYTDMTEFNRVDDGKNPDVAKLEEAKHYRLNPGEVGTYSHGAIHAINYPDKSRFIRVTGTNLDNIWRVAFDPETGRVKKMGPQQAT
jgi:predicted metal-dependent enzyme (double-stranded beta helix superfamily)